MFSTNGWFVVKLNESNLLYTYPQVIPPKPPWSTAEANWWMMECRSPCPWGRAGMDPQETWQGQRWKRKTWKVEEEGAGAQNISLKQLLISLKQLLNDLLGVGRKWVNFGTLIYFQVGEGPKRNSPSRSHQIILRISGIWIIFSVAYWVGIESSNWNYHFNSKSSV